MTEFVGLKSKWNKYIEDGYLKIIVIKENILGGEIEIVIIPHISANENGDIEEISFELDYIYIDNDEDKNTKFNNLVLEAANNSFDNSDRTFVWDYLDQLEGFSSIKESLQLLINETNYLASKLGITGEELYKKMGFEGELK